MFSVDPENLVKNKIHICKEYHIQPSEIDRMVYFEYEWLIATINKEQKEEQERQEQEQQDYGTPNYNSIMKQAQANIPKTPSTPSMPSMPAMPKINLPHF